MSEAPGSTLRLALPSIQQRSPQCGYHAWLSTSDEFNYTNTVALKISLRRDDLPELESEFSSHLGIVCCIISVDELVVLVNDSLSNKVILAAVIAAHFLNGQTEVEYFVDKMQAAGSQ